MSTGSERRKKERFDANLFLEIISGSLNQSVGRGVLIDVSLSGLSVQTEADLKPGEKYLIDIEIPLSLKAEVVRTIKGGQVKQYGFRLLDQGFIDKLVLRKLLKGRRRTRKV